MVREAARPSVPPDRNQAGNGAAPFEHLVTFLRACPLLFGIPDADIATVAAVCSTHAFRAGQQIFSEGQPSTGLWVLAEGRVRLFHADIRGRQQVVSFRGPTSSLELAAALDGRKHGASAAALEDCTLIYVPRSTLVSLSRAYPITIRNVIDQLCLELRQQDIATAITSLRDARGRIGCTLLQLAREHGSPIAGGSRIEYRLTRQDIADRSAVTLETAIRVLSSLQRSGALRTRAQVIEIVDLAGLERLTECESCELDCSVFATPRPPASPPR